MAMAVSTTQSPAIFSRFLTTWSSILLFSKGISTKQARRLCVTKQQCFMKLASCCDQSELKPNRVNRGWIFPRRVPVVFKMEDFEPMAPMWNVEQDLDKRFSLCEPGELAFAGEAGIADPNHLAELIKHTDVALGQSKGLAKQWDFQHNDMRSRIQAELDALEAQRLEAEARRREILQEPVASSSTRSVLVDNHPCSSTTTSLVGNSSSDKPQELLVYWKERAERLRVMLEDSLRREELLMKQLDELRKLKAKQAAPTEVLQSQLERVDNFLHFVLRNAPITVSHQDKDLRYRFIYNQYPGFQAKDFIGKRDEDFYQGIGLDEGIAFKREVMRRGLPAKREFVLETPEIGKKAFLYALEPVFSRDGEVIGLNNVSVDLTDEYLKREKLIALREEAAVRRATESELHKTILLTEETMRAKQLLAVMSHEIRSPLAGILSTAELLATTNLDNEQHQLIQIMMTSGKLVLQLINDILDLSKVESGFMKLEAKKFRLREVVKNVLQMVVPSAQRKGLILEGLVVDEVPFEVVGDVLRIRQILANLISNAITATDKGIVGVVVRKLPAANNPKAAHKKKSEEQEEMDVVWLHIEVFDTGVGIPEASIPELFREYIQSSSKKEDGTGLGLVICKQLVELMGGELKVASKENEGSAFSFTLPCKVSLMKPSMEAPTDNGYFKFIPNEMAAYRQGLRALSYSQSFQNRMDPAIKEEKRRSSRCGSENIKPSHFQERPPKILLAEDDQVNVMVAKSMLKRLGLHPHVVGDGVEAVKAVHRDKYDLVLMDVCMPNMDGLQATKLIREYEKATNSKRTPIIAMTANALAEDVADCYAQGMDSFVAKPATFKRLEHVLLKFLSHLQMPSNNNNNNNNNNIEQGAIKQ